MDDIRGLKPFLIFAPNWKLIALIALAVLALALAAAWWLRRPRPVAEAAGPVGPAPAAAPLSVREQLDQLKAKKLIEQNRVRAFHGELSAIVRAFLGSRFDLPGRRLTTTELLEALERRGLEPATYQLIADFLMACDMAKFAKAGASRADMESRLGNAYQLVASLGDAPVPLEADGDDLSEAERDVVG